jgi:tetrahydromethanopterin S-methyltransferase subunit F
MPDQITGLQFAGIVCGTLFAIGLITILVAWW